MHTVVRYFGQLTLRHKQASKYFFLLPETHLNVIYDIYVAFPTTPHEIIKMCSIVNLISFIMSIWVLDTTFLKDSYLIISKLQAACLYHKYFKNYKLLNI